MLTEYLPIAALMLTVVGAVWSLAWWLSGQFSSIKSVVFGRIEKLEATLEGKLEYHEKHDDERFNQIRNDIWEMRLKSAALRDVDKAVNGK